MDGSSPHLRHVPAPAETQRFAAAPESLTLRPHFELQNASSHQPPFSPRNLRAPSDVSNRATARVPKYYRPFWASGNNIDKSHFVEAGSLGDSFLRTTGIPLATESLLSELDRCAQDPDVQPQTPLTQSHES